jgi:hypothetical protein
MELKFVEAGGQGNWGKFAVGRFTAQEWAEPPRWPGAADEAKAEALGMLYRPLVASQGWTHDRHVWVLDLATGEGAVFQLGGYAKADLDRHRIWVCPLFEPFLTWLYEHHNTLAETWWEDLPRLVELRDAPFELRGYRRPGPLEATT